MIIPMTKRGPIEIDPEQWPVVAESRDARHGASLTVRRHADGRHLVYGTALNDAGDGHWHAGMLAPVDLASAIVLVSSHLLGSRELLADCLGQLPPERV